MAATQSWLPARKHGWGVRRTTRRGVLGRGVVVVVVVCAATAVVEYEELTYKSAHLGRCAAHGVRDVAFRAGGQQRAAHGRVAAERGEMQRGVPVLVFARVDVGALRDENKRPINYRHRRRHYPAGRPTDDSPPSSLTLSNSHRTIRSLPLYAACCSGVMPCSSNTSALRSCLSYNLRSPSKSLTNIALNSSSSSVVPFLVSSPCIVTPLPSLRRNQRY